MGVRFSRRQSRWLMAASLQALLSTSGLLVLPAGVAAQENSGDSSSKDDGQLPPPSAPDAASQKDDGQVDSGIIVTGIRASIEKSINAKKASNEIVEVVSAEDIGKLPGVSIAESLARLPGVAAQRVDGRAQVLSIRGMAPQFGMTLLNGQEMVSTGDDRSFEYDQFPAELVSSATLYKTPDASLGAMGLSGTVDIHTLEPLDFNGRKINMSLRYDGNSMGKVLPSTSSHGGRLSFSYIDQFADGKIGVALGYAHLDSPNKKKYFNLWDYGKASVIGVEGLGDTYTFDGFETGIASTKTVRDGYLGVLQFKPDEHFSSKIDLFRSQFKQRMKGDEMIGVLANWATGSIPVVAMNSDSIQVDNASPILTMRQDNRNDRINAVSWANSYSAGAWTFRADLGYSKATRREWVGEAYLMSATPMSLTVDLPTDFNSFGHVTSSVDLNSTTDMSLASVWGENLGGMSALAKVQDKVETARLSARSEMDFGPFNGLEVGLLYRKRTKSLNYEQTSYYLTDSSPCLNGLTCQAIPDSLHTYSANMGFMGMPNVLYFNVDDALGGSGYEEAVNALDPSWNWGVREKVTTLFAKLDIRDDHWVPIRGNIGVQVIRTSQSASGLYVDALGDASLVDGGISYTDILPSLNLNAQLAQDTFLRLGAAKALARAEMADMRAGITAAVSQTDRKWYGDGGNPKLKPWISYDFDLSLEHYIGKASYIAVAAFYKDITRGIVTKDVQYDFSGYANTSNVTPISSIGTLTTPTNTKGGKLRGVEVSWTLEGDLLTSFLSGFGFAGSYSKSKLKPKTDKDGVFLDTLLEGFSGDVWSGSLYYEKDGIQLRVGERYRSGYSARRHNAFLFVTENIKSEHIVDAQIGYTVQSGPLKDLAITLQGNNLTNEAYVTSQTVDGQTAPQQYHKFGTEYLLGISYSF